MSGFASSPPLDEKLNNLGLVSSGPSTMALALIGVNAAATVIAQYDAAGDPTVDRPGPELPAETTTTSFLCLESRSSISRSMSACPSSSDPTP